MATKVATSSPKVQEFQFHSIPKTTKWEDFQNSLYDPAKQEFFGRNKKSWGQLLLFYAIFYVCLSILFAICMKGMLGTLDDKAPKWQLSESLIGTNPGLGFRPISNETSEGSLIWYNLNETQTSQKWVNLIDDFLRPYKLIQKGANFKPCDYGKPPEEGHVCPVEVDRFGPCTPDNNYGYSTNSPCVFLKLNRIFGWKPDYYTTGQPEMPSDLREIIGNATSDNGTQVWISCKGEHPVDRERIGEFSYFPSRGFPGYYFPYRNDANYLSPIIAVQVHNVAFNVIVNIECRAWAKNINYNGNNDRREGSVHFEVLVD